MRWAALAARRIHDRTGADRERGATMVEIIVAMVIMTICGAIFTGAVISLFRSSDAAQAVTNSGQQTNQAYQALDKRVRYARAITAPGTGSGTGNWYVELSDSTNGAEVCTQLQLNRVTGVLQLRTWQASSPSTTTSAWRALGSTFTNGGAAAGSDDQPFVLVPPSATAVKQRLTVTLVARAGPASTARTSRSSFTLTALNSVVPATTPASCQQLGRP